MTENCERHKMKTTIRHVSVLSNVIEGWRKYFLRETLLLKIIRVRRFGPTELTGSTLHILSL